MDKPIDAIMRKEMTRLEFLMTLGFGVASLMGFSTIIKLLTGKSVEQRLGQHASRGYGATSYGGGSES